ncbi:MAG: hypothetical protein IJ050_06905 [Clostridia bacterium]|nr:hypothetical protein [Clostridia bacterium]
MNKKVKKTVIITAAVIAAALVAVFFNRSKLIVYFSQRSINSGDYSTAETLLEYDKSETSAALGEYINLRRDIKRQYPSLLREFDAEKIAEWRASAKSLYEKDAIGNASINACIKKIYAGTGLILSADSEYSNISADVDSLLDVFSEYNRLRIQKNGVNTVFTLREEYSKLEKWQANLKNISDYAEVIPDYENVYLLSYLIKEAQSEIVQLKSEMDAAAADGYALDDNVHYNGSSARNFPAINNGSGTVITFRNKPEFEKHLLAGIRNQLVSTQLLKFYYGAE